VAVGPPPRPAPPGGPPAGLGPLVGSVGAVDIAVAHPEARHAHAVVALEGGGAAGERGAAELVGAVGAVGLVVAHEARGDTLATRTAELALRAAPGRWGVERVYMYISIVERERGEREYTCILVS